MKDTPWLYTISPKKRLLAFNFKEIWRYRDLLLLFVKRDIITVYKQTILGPLWFFLKPLLTSAIQFFIFGKIAAIPSDGTPYFLFVLAGNTLWFYFAECFNGTSDTFKKNENIFGKVYFPRVIMPISIVVSNLLKFGIQFLLFFAFWSYFVYSGTVSPQWNMIIALPLLLLCMALLSLGFGMIISSMTTKYRDLTFLITFGVQLYMYISPVIYPISILKEKVSGLLGAEHQHWVDTIIYANPLSSILEVFKYAFLGEGTFTLGSMLYSIVFCVFIFLVGLLIFNRTEKSFIDTI